MKIETAFYEKLEDGKVKCKICSHYCVIKPGTRGYCKTRVNEDGTLYSLIYGAMISKGFIDPIEKKPLYHFLPAAKAYSIASVGCSMNCLQCQNWSLSRAVINDSGKVASVTEDTIDRGVVHGESFIMTQTTPEQLANDVIHRHCETLAYTYTEPTIWFEFIRDSAPLVRKKGIKTILVSNGYSNPETNAEYVNFIDAANIDLKGFTKKFYQEVCKVPEMDPVLNTIKYFHEHGVHVEITNLIIPNRNDNLEEISAMCEWILNNVGPYVPVHFSAYHPAYKMNEPRTETQILIRAYEIARSKGLKYVFLGNVMTEKGNDSVCPQCGNVLIRRSGYYVKVMGVNDAGKCKQCGFETKIKMKIN